MRLHLFQCGWIRTKKHLLVAGPREDGEFVVPIPFYLIRHPTGNVLFDAGQPMAAVNAADGGDYVPIMTPADHVQSQLARLGMGTADISQVVLSHLHADHAGGIEAIPDATCYLQRRELGGRSPADIAPSQSLRWHLLDGERGVTHDLFGDGKVRILFTPGHTPGHQSLLLELDDWGTVLLAADSVYTDEVLSPGGFPGVCADREETARTLAAIRELRDRGVRVIAGHDPDTWRSFRLAPSYYR